MRRWADPAEGRAVASPTPNGRTLARAVLKLQRDAGNRATARVLQRAAAVPYVSFSVAVSRPMSSRELLVEFAVQTRKAESLTPQDAEAGIANGEIYWVDGAGNKIGFDHEEAPTVSAEEAKQGYKLLMVYAHGVTPLSDAQLEQARREFYGLGETEQDEINRQTNEMFWAMTGYKVGEKLDPENDPDDARLAQDWLRIRAEVVGLRRRFRAQAPDMVRVLYEMVPEDSRQYMFSGSGQRLRPSDYAAALRVVERIAAMTPEERAQYWARVQGTTTSWSAFELSLDFYAAEREFQEEAAGARGEAAAALREYEDLYFAYMAYDDALRDAAAWPGGVWTLGDESEALRAAMERHGFATMSEVSRFLEPRTAAFAAAFEEEGILVGDEMLDRFRHLLWSESERLLVGGRLRAFHEAVSGARGNLASLADEWPLLHDEELRERLARTYSAGGMYDCVRYYAKERRESIWTAEQELHANHDLIYAFDVLLETALTRIGASEGSMYRDIVERRKKKIDDAQLLKTIGFTILAIVAGILTRGGTIGLISGGVAVGLGVWETLEEFRNYEIGVAGHEAGLLSDDPSLFWVIVSAMGVLGDAAAVVKLVSTMGDAARTLDDAADLERFQRLYDERLMKAKMAGDGKTAKALEDARAPIFAAARKRVRKRDPIDDELDDAFRETDDLPIEPPIELRVAGDAAKKAPTEPVKIVEEALSSDEIVRDFRIPSETQKKFQDYVDAKDIEVFVRPTSKESLVRIYEGDIMKPEEIKAKTINELDHFLGAPRSASGKVGYFKPSPPMRPAPGTSDPHWDALVAQFKSEDEAWDELVKRFAQRDEEFWAESRKMTELQQPPKIKPDGTPTVEVKIDGGVVSDIERRRAFTGDHDLYEIRRADGSRLSDAEYDEIVAEMKKQGIIQHGAHLRWEPTTATDKEIYARIVREHEVKGVPLVRFAKGKDPSRAGAPKRQD